MRASALSSLVIAGALLAGCGGEGTIRIDSTLAVSSALEAATQVDDKLELQAAQGTLVLERARIAVSEVELEGEEENDDEEFEMGARVVEVALGGAPTEIVAQSVPTGSYAELGMELMLASAGNGASFGDFNGGSIVVDGSYEGTPFAYGSGIAPELEFNLPTPAEVTDGGDARIAVTFDVAAWFVGPDGVALDPSDPANRATIEDNILNSMAAYAEIELTDDD